VNSGRVEPDEEKEECEKGRVIQSAGKMAVGNRQTSFVQQLYTGVLISP